MARIKKKKKGLTVSECVKKARKYIKEYGICLLWFDVRGSRRLDLRQLRRRLEAMIKDLNSKFADYFPENDLAVINRSEKGFPGIILGDLSYVGINDAEIIPEIVKYQKEKYPDISFWWGVAKDGYTKKDWQ